MILIPKIFQIWILLLPFLSLISCAKYEDCDQPPDIENGSSKITIDENEEFVTVTYQCNHGYRLVGESQMTCDLDTDEWDGEPPKCEEHSDSLADNKKRKGKVHDIQEEKGITSSFAKNLDLSCMSKGLVKAPNITNGYILKYNRRKKDDNIFLVAFYDCEEGFELEDIEKNRLYCSKGTWVGDQPVCMSIDEDEEEEGDYDEENESGAENENEDEEEQEEEENEEDLNREHNEIDAPLARTTTETPTTKRQNLTFACGADQGGCDHNCVMVQLEWDPEPRIECSCHAGFILDETDGRRCHDINECNENNGGCEQICNNIPGSFECTCHRGLQLDTTNNKKCIDINECLLRNGHGPCQDTCHNYFGGYNCSCDGLPNTILSADLHNCEDAGECANNNGGCSHKCLSTMGRIYCLCPDGFVLGDDWKTCQDVNECEDPSLSGHCEHGCENHYGSFVCKDPPTTTTTTTTTTTPSTTTTEIVEPQTEAVASNENEEESRGNEDEEEEDDYNDEYDDEIENGMASKEDTSTEPHPVHSTTTPQNIEMTSHSTSHIEPDEDEEDDDDEEKTASHDNDIDDENEEEVTTKEEEIAVSAEQLSTVGPTTEITHSHERSKESDHIFKQESVDEVEEEQTSMENETHVENDDDEEDIDENEEEDESEDISSEKEMDREDNQSSFGAPAVTRKCDDGLRLDDGGNCVDIDECADGNTGCQYCENVYGGYECTCPDGWELGDDEKTCVDINECEAYSQSESGEEEDEEQQSSPYSVCSHECINTIGSFICLCPENFHLHIDKRTCIPDYCEDLLNPELHKSKCSHHCVDNDKGYVCQCPDNYELENDLKTCKRISAEDTHEKEDDTPSRSDEEEDNEVDEIDENEEKVAEPENNEDDIPNEIIIECSDDDIARCKPGRCLVEYSEIRCECPPGFLEKSRSCQDMDECEYGTHECSHNCHNLYGNYECSCPSGLKLSSDGKTCDDVDECEFGDEEICGELECRNTYGGFKCVCPDGKERNEYGECVETNLCKENNGGCSHNCRSHYDTVICECPNDMELDEDRKTCVYTDPCSDNNGGCSHHCDSLREEICYCPHGFVLQDDQQTCQDIDECLVNNGGCDQICVNLDGHYECQCNTGYEIHATNNKTCSDIDECLTNNGECDHICINDEGGSHCSCRSGYTLNELDGVTCDDVDECSDQNGNCSHRCLNLPGSYQCSCPYGQVLMEDDLTCGFIDECDFNNGGCAHNCHYTEGVVTCSCRRGYQIDEDDEKNCVDIDECQTDNGGCAHVCHNHEGGHECSCRHGYDLSHNKLSCNDIDECIENNGNCSNICINLLGSYNCACEAGFQLLDEHTCVDIDECAENIHDCSHICINVPGTFECDCPIGFELGKDQFTCVDINECADNNGNCSYRCENLVGSHKCICEDGHILHDDEQSCVDIDECNEENNRCSHECINFIGGFNCSCPKGLTLHDDKLNCIDIDECADELFNGNCSHICENAHGTHHCKCPEGYKLEDDLRTCEDTNECLEENGGCSDICINTEGSYHCKCPDHQTLSEDGKTCKNKDPCKINNGGCSQACSFEHHRVVCSCRKGFEMKNGTCHDINECEGNHGCQQNCVNTIGGFRCECRRGYRFNKDGHCIDIDECKLYDDRCPSNARCVNTAGSFRCICPEGFKITRDKKQCVEIKNQCAQPKAPHHGEIRCTQSRHKTQHFYRTKCVVKCNKGYKLVGSQFRNCNGSGHWDSGEEPTCVPLSCNRIPRPEHGTILPTTCMSGKTFAGERCFLHCAPGYKPAGKRVAVCDTDLKWKPHQELKCVATHALLTEAAAPVIFKPHIQCPKDLVKVLPKGQETVLVHIEKPVTNVDWYKFVDSYPSWGKRLEANLPLGITEVTFRAKNPNSNHVDICRVVIRVIEVHPPRVVNCPESFIVNLEPNEMYRVINWNEASFESAPEDPIKQVYKSRVPGNKMGAGVHSIAYVATTENGFSAKCNFKIVVKPHGAIRRPLEELRLPPQEPKRPNRFDNHESFLVCDGKPPIKIHSNYPWHLPRGCVIKNVRVHRHKDNMGDNERRRQQFMQQRSTKAPDTSNADDHAQQQQQQQQQRGLANRLRYYSTFNRMQGQTRRQHPNNYYWHKKK